MAQRTRDISEGHAADFTAVDRKVKDSDGRPRGSDGADLTAVDLDLCRRRAAGD